MKFVVLAVVIVALAAGAQSSAIPWLAVTGPGGAIAEPGSIAVQASVANGPLAAVAVQAIPNIVAAPVAVDVAPAAAVHGQGTYVAKTRGVVHVAPLPGHVQSATALNLQPAPGTV